MRMRVAVVLAAAAVAAAMGILIGQSPGYAANLGTVSLSAKAGSVTADPIVASAVTSAACPRGYGENAALRVGRPGGPYSNLAPPAGAGGYDGARVTLRPNRSFAKALGATPQDGEWWVVVECYSLSQGRHPDRFATPIWVSSGTWQLSPPGGAAGLAATPGTSGTTSQQRLGVTVTPSDNPASPAPSGSASPSPSAPAGAGPGGGGGLAKTGMQILLVVLLGLALVAAGTGTVYLVRRRRTDPGSTGVTG